MNDKNSALTILASGFVAVAVVVSIKIFLGIEYNPSRWIFGEIGTQKTEETPLNSNTQLAPPKNSEPNQQPVFEHIGEKPKTTPGEVYQYNRKDGSVAFTDNPTSIPQGADVQTRNWNGSLTGPKVEIKKGMSKETQIIVKNDQVFVPVTIRSNGKENNLWLLLDTGATGITIYNNAAEGFYMANVRRGISTLADGRSVTNVLGTVESVSVGPAIVRNAEIHIIPQAMVQDHQGLLGMKFLKHFHYTLDMGRQVIRWN